MADDTPFEQAAQYVREGRPLPHAMEELLRAWAADDPHAWRDLDLIPFSQLQVEHVDWIIPGLVPHGMLSVLAGQQGLGKSLLHARWASDLSRDGVPSILVSAEDSPTHTTKARLIAAEANERLIYHAAILPVLGNGKNPQWLARIRGWIESTQACMLIFDPMMAFIDAQSDSYKTQHVRLILSELDAVARDLQCAIVYIMHGTKRETFDPLKWIAGSGAWTEAARSVILLAAETDPYQPQRIVAHVKCNVGEKAMPQRWEVEPIMLPALAGRDVRTARISYRGIAEGIDVGALLAAPLGGDEKGEREQANELIRDCLTTEMRTSELMETLREYGVSQRTAERARREMGVQAVKRGKVWWCLPLSQSNTATGKTANPPGGVLFSLNDAGSQSEKEGSPPRAHAGGVHREEVSQSPPADRDSDIPF